MELVIVAVVAIVLIFLNGLLTVNRIIGREKQVILID